jgi:N-acyl-D-amino-acid deacylase
MPARPQLFRLAALFLAIAAPGCSQPADLDILIRNGRVLDGSGNPWSRLDVAIRGDRIVAVGRFPDVSARLVVDARDRFVAPGFIDAHSHAAPGLLRPELHEARPLLAQGLTTIIANPDGGGPPDLRAQAEQLTASGPGVNVALVVGHGTIRNVVMGRSQRRAPTAGELEEMRALVRQARADGAFGMSSGLFYMPGRFATTEEVIALAREAGSVYTSHIRDEGSCDFGVVAAVDEVIRVAEEAGVRGIVTHLKYLGPDSWGLSRKLVDNITAARARGVEVFADQYPYEASSTGLSAATTPGESTAAVRAAMADDTTRPNLLDRIKGNIRRRGGPASIVIASGTGAPGLSGQSLEQIAHARDTRPDQAAADIILAGGASIVSFNMSEEDIAHFMRQPWTMGSTDGGLTRPGPEQVHPRSYGAMPRRLARYVRERGTVTLEHAVRTMTSLPAQVFGLVGRGEVRAGAFADLVIFDLTRVQDRATYQEPRRLADGLDWVFVNGQVARREGEFTGVRAGRALRR